MKIKLLDSFFIITTLGLILGKIFLLIGLPSYIPDLLGLTFVLLIWFMALRFKQNKNELIHFLNIFLLISVLFCFAKAITSSSIVSSISSIYRIILVQIFLLVGYNLSEKNYNRNLQIQNNLFYVISFIAIIQFFFHENLPRFLISPSLFDNYVSGVIVGDFSAIRANGLFGNPLELMAFSSVLLFLNKKNKFLKVTTIILTISRAGFILIILRYLKRYFLVFSALSLILFAFLFNGIINLGVFSRLLFLSSESTLSTLSRLNYIKELSSFSYTELLYGLDLGSISARGRSDVTIEIYDGFFINIIAEYGIVYFILYMSIIFYMLVKIFKKNTINGIALITLFGVLGITGSAQLHPTVGGLIYLAIGYYLKNENRSSISNI